jgi:hypothetical protein
MSVCHWWLERGFKLLPVQPNSKRLVFGWGIYQKQVSSLDQAKQVFGVDMPYAGLAVFAPDGLLVLDFDEIGIYTQWEKDHPEISKTYTEKTPRDGRHVFIKCAAPSGLILHRGIESKKVCVVSPSIANDKAYQRGEGEILEADPKNVFDGLTVPGTRTVYAIKNYNMSASTRAGLIERIKQRWTVEDVFKLYHPEITFRPSGKVIACCCPFHEDKTPSFYILPEIGLWGCHACGIRGDVINLYARFQGIDNREAISRMSHGLQEGRA